MRITIDLGASQVHQHPTAFPCMERSSVVLVGSRYQKPLLRSRIYKGLPPSPPLIAAATNRERHI